MKNFLFSICFGILCLCCLTPATIFAQDTVSTADIEFTPAPQPKSSATVNPQKPGSIKATVKTTATSKTGPQKTLWAIFVAGLIGGFAAVLMPCIFPMLPMTVSFFIKGGGAGKAILYGVSIIVIYVALGLLITMMFGPDALNSLSTNGFFNFFFFILLVVFAASFLGAFEITLPSSWVNKMDQQSDKGGMMGIFFMAATLSLVSFSCTGPIIGTLLVQAATTGALLGPAVGMFGFSFALALPFALFAMFPTWLGALPKSGGWLNSVKVVLGFLELALSLKFLSNVDLAYRWHLFDREVFLVLWIVIFGLMGLYLLGKIRFSHDSPLPHLSVTRLFLSIIVLSFATFLVPGLWGAPLKSVSALLPPRSTQDFDLSVSASAATVNSHTGPRKYEELFDKPKGFDPFFDYEEGLAFARKVNKPIMIDFTGHACVNCRKMEETVWPDPRVTRMINDDFVLIQLYVDDKKDLPVDEQILTPEGRRIKTIGNKFSYFQTSRFQSNSQPFYVLLDPTNEQALVEPEGANFDTEQYLKYLQSGRDAFAGKK